MKKILPILLLALLSLLVGCSIDGDNTITPSIDGGHIASVSEQMDAIEASLPKLHNTATKARALVSEQISETRGDDDNDVKTMIEALEERVAALEEYIAGGGEGSWRDTTYATLDMYEETIALLAELQAEIDVLKGQNDAKYEDVLDSIEESVNSMKAWVNELLTGYYDIATIDAMFAKLLEDLSADDAAIRSEIEAIRKELDKQFDDMEDAYRDAIREAIEENNGRLSEQLTKEIEAVNSRIGDEVEKLNKRLDDIEERLSKLEDSVSDILKRIQSITYIPLYDDNTARVLCPNEGLEGSTVQLDFTISPRDAAEDLAAVWQKAVSVKALYTGSPVMTDLPVVSCTAYADQGLLSVVAACDNLSWEFYNDDVKARAIMYISDGNNDLASEYIPMIPQRSQIPNNQIWYTVTGKTPIDIQQGYGPKIVSNTFDQSKDVYIVTFEEDIYSIPADYFGGKVELRSVVLPNSISSIDDYAFSGCYNLSDISLGLSLRYIGSRAFEGCAIHTLNLPASLYGVNSEAFTGSSIVQFAGDMVADDGISLILNNALVAIAPAGIGTEYGVPTEAITIGDGVFRDFSGIKHINIHDEITSIGYEAFKNCASLTSIAIPDSVESIGDGIFAGCTSLKSLSLGVNIESINKEMFTGCDSIEQFSGKFASEDGSALIYNGTLMVFAKACGLQEYTISANITHIEERVFANCSNISLFRFESTTPPTLGANVFAGIDNLQISIPKEAVEAYLTCDWPYDYRRAIIELTDINNFPDSCRIYYTTCTNQKLDVYPEDGYTVISHDYSNGQGIIVFFEPPTTIIDRAFEACSILTSVTIPNSVTTIGEYAFSGCTSLTSVNIPDSVTSIGEYAFVDCTILTSVNIPNSVTTIGEYAFANCQNLTSVTIGDSVTTIGEYAFAYCFSLTSVNIPNSVTSIGDWAFWYCTRLTSVTIGDSVTTIGEYAFYYCTRLTSVTIGDSVTSIGDCVFAYCNSLTSVNIPNSVTSIGDCVFSGCESLTSVTIPDGVTSIGYEAFNYCIRLTSVNIPNSVTSIGDRAFCCCSSLTSVTIPDSVTSIGNGAFVGCTRLTSVNIPNSVTSIGDSVFSGCTSLTSVNIPNSVTSIGDHLFYHCASLTSITIPDGVTSIGNEAFYSCKSLTSVTIPDSVTTIGSYAFSRCDSLTSVNIPNSVTTIVGAFSNCSSLTSITIPDSVTEIGNDTFYGCWRLTSITIPDSVTSIGNEAFAFCTSLTSITIPDSVTSIGNEAFYSCKSLKSVYCKAITPPAGGSDMFDDNAVHRRIYVPMESVEAYKSADGWKDYSAISIVGYDFDNGVVVE